MDYALALVIVGVMLVWAYYAPRLVATVREVREARRLRLAAQGNKLESVRPADRRTERAWLSIVRYVDRTDPAWATEMRTQTFRSRRWLDINRK